VGRYQYFAIDSICLVMASIRTYVLKLDESSKWLASRRGPFGLAVSQLQSDSPVPLPPKQLLYSMPILLHQTKTSFPYRLRLRNFFCCHCQRLTKSSRFGVTCFGCNHERENCHSPKDNRTLDLHLRTLMTRGFCLGLGVRLGK
jgi:hypothetical protein